MHASSAAVRVYSSDSSDEFLAWLSLRYASVSVKRSDSVFTSAAISWHIRCKSKQCGVTVRKRCYEMLRAFHHTLQEILDIQITLSTLTLLTPTLCPTIPYIPPHPILFPMHPTPTHPTPHHTTLFPVHCMTHLLTRTAREWSPRCSTLLCAGLSSTPLRNNQIQNRRDRVRVRVRDK